MEIDPKEIARTPEIVVLRRVNYDNIEASVTFIAPAFVRASIVFGRVVPMLLVTAGLPALLQ